MIPASYLFRNYYAREWLEDRPEASPAPGAPDPGFAERLARRIAAAIPARPIRWPNDHAADLGRRV